MSFFDEGDEADEVEEPSSGPRTETRVRRPARGSGPRAPRRPPGRPPTSHNQQVQTRRLIAVGVVVVIVIAMALLIHGCQVSQTNSSMKSYAGNVSSLINQSNNNGASMFKDLRSGEGSGDVESLQEQLNSVLNTAQSELSTAQGYSVPSQMATAQQALLQVMQLRYDGIHQIAAHIQDALNTATSVDGVYELAQGTSMLYASDVLYKLSVGTGIAAALNTAAIPIGGVDGVPIAAGQIVPDLGWLNKTDVAVWIGASVPSSQVNTCASGQLCGHALNYVNVGTTQLVPGSTNTVPASPAPTFTLNITNGGTNNEFDVQCKVWVQGLNDSATATIPETLPNHSYNCSVPLPTSPTAGTYTVHAEVLRVPGEKNTKNNSLQYSVVFN